MAAAFTSAAMSAPVMPSVISTSLSRFTSDSSGFFFVCIWNICFLASLSGTGTWSILSNLPGRNRASSMISGLFVAPITTTPFRSSNPSSSVSIWLMTRSVTCESPSEPPLLGAIASSSSKNITQGAAWRAFLKTSLTPFSDSPTHLLINSGPLMLMKLASDVAATDLAIMVLPVPGGP